MTHNLKPYPAYKDSGVPWLGKVPEHWEKLPGRACYQEKKVPNSGMQEQTVLSLSYGKIVIKPPEKLHGLVPASFETYQIIDPGDIIVRPTDLQNDWNSLRFGLSPHKGIITSAYMCLYTTVLMLREYGYLFLHAYDLKKIFYGLGSGLRQNLDWRDFKYLPCLAPPTAEQAAIVRYLDYMDRRIRRYIRAKQKLIKLLEEQKQSFIHQAVTGQIDVRTGQPYPAYKPSGAEWLGEVPEHWDAIKIRHFAKVGNGSTPSRSRTDYWSNEHFAWLNSSVVNQDRVNHTNQFVTELALQECHLPILAPGDVLIAITGQGKTRGKSAVLAMQATINQHLAYIRIQKNWVFPEYLQLIFSGAYSYLRSISDDSGSTRGALTCADIRHFKVPVPSIREQQHIMDWVRDATDHSERTIKTTQQEIDLLREYHTRLIADVVTGKLDVRQAAAGLPEEVAEPELLEEVADIDADDAAADDLDDEMDEAEPLLAPD